MQDKRLFSHNELTGVTEWFVFDEDTSQVTMVAEQDVGDITDQNLASQNEVAQRGMRWGEFTRVASIPMALYGQWLIEGRTRDQGWLRRWLNERDNRLFRTRLGRV